MTFIKRQSVAFNILNNISEDSTAEYLEKGKRGQIGEIREWKGGKFRKTVNGWEPVREGGESKKKEEDGNIVDNVNNGEVINSLFKEWNSIKTSEQHEKWAKKVANTKFGTYKDKTILNVMGDFNPKFPNEIIKKDFINEVQEAYKNSGESKEKEVVREKYSSEVKRVMDALTTANSKYSDPNKVTVNSTPKGNWRVYYDGKETGVTLGGNQISEDTIRDNQWEHHDF